MGVTLAQRSTSSKRRPARGTPALAAPRKNQLQGEPGMGGDCCVVLGLSATADAPPPTSAHELVSAKLVGEVCRRKFSRSRAPGHWQRGRWLGVAALAVLAVATIAALSGTLADTLRPEPPEEQTRLRVSDKLRACKMGWSFSCTQDNETCRRWKRAFHWVDIAPFVRQPVVREQSHGDGATDAGSFVANSLPRHGDDSSKRLVESVLRALASITLSKKKYCNADCKGSALFTDPCSICRGLGTWRDSTTLALTSSFPGPLSRAATHVARPDASERTDASSGTCNRTSHMMERPHTTP